jgi:hypothetical protein
MFLYFTSGFAFPNCMRKHLITGHRTASAFQTSSRKTSTAHQAKKGTVNDVLTLYMRLKRPNGWGSVIAEKALDERHCY